MPRVTMASVSAVNFRQFLTTLLNSVSSVTIWSLGDTTMFALGFSFLMRQLT